MKSLILRISILTGGLMLASTLFPQITNSISYNTHSQEKEDETLAVIRKVNDRWQAAHPEPGNAFWHTAAYHTGNMAAYFATGNEAYRKYSEAWAEANEWKGARSDNKAQWKYDYGETSKHVLFGDWQICFQTYIDLYNLQPEERKIARAREVMEYEMETPNNDYWWWVDGLYMVMPVMTKFYKTTGNPLYLQKLHEYFSYAKQLIYDEEAGLFYRDAKYIYPKHKTRNGKKDFWARGNGWAFAGLAKVLSDLPANDVHREEYIRIFRSLAKALKAAQQPEGHWTRSVLDEQQAPGYETSGTAFFAYGFLWGINNGILKPDEYAETAQSAWRYLTEIALQPDGTVGYVQPIGERADQHNNINGRSTADFGVGAFLLAACEKLRSLDGKLHTENLQTFEIGSKTFLLNGQPFVIKAAELHYPRIPEEYWEHRIAMCKALGMNTICLYVFWNIHEQEEGKFDFTGNNDVAAFCRLAQKHGMYVILRPGPYVCAEWEMGGLPWWLLKKKDIALRTQDPYFMERVRIFMAEVGRQTSDLQLANGGNILMVQVENEYGAYGVNKPYIAGIRNIVKASGFDKAPLFQCDWSSNFENNALDDLFWTLNFGTGANIDAQFKRLKELRPETPLMCSEFWSGWFDHWGAKHETRSAEELVAGMKAMLDKNISFSLYMTHGGTSFGHWAGANFPGYVPDCTSYDYDAPISESGRTTPKYFKVRELLQSYLPEGETLPDIPDSIPTIAIPSITFKEFAPLFDNLPEPKTSEDIHPMEYFNQGWGSILYRTTLKKSGARQFLKVTEAHDWAQIYIDGERIGILNRLKGEGTLQLPPVREGAVLDILVEAMGRRNFGAGVLDYKGITEKVELVSEQETVELKNWLVYSIPVDYAFAQNKNYRKITGTVTSPAYYRAVFHPDKTGDTFLDMSHWKKGMVYVNGHNLGRFWEIGPQQALYLPGCWLNKGENEIIVLDMVGTENPTVAGLRQPILDVLRGNGAYKFRKHGETLDLSGEKPVYSGSFRTGNGWQKIRFDSPQPTRYFCLEALNSHGNDDFASIAELEILDAGGKRLSRQHWKVIYADSEEADNANNIAVNVFDLQESTIWHTSYSVNKDKFPHQIIIDLGEDKTVGGFEYLPRQEANKPAMIKDFRIYVKTTMFKL